MKTLSSIGLSSEYSKEISEKLNELLANFQIYYQNLRGLHWNIKGENFFELHVKFEELYTDVQLKIDLIAERILTLGYTPYHTFSDYLSIAKVPIGKDISSANESVELIVKSINQLLLIERIIFEKSSNLNDEGSASMISDFIAEQEKTMWMFNAWLGK